MAPRTDQRQQALWVTWEIQRRNRSMARLVGADLHEMRSPARGVRRYASLWSATFRLVRSRRPAVVYFQNPSLLLGLLLVAMKYLGLHQSALVADYHNAGVRPPLGWIGLTLTRWIARGADLVIVSNDALCTELESWKARAVAIPDPVPGIGVAAEGSAAKSGHFNVLFICSWATDEPLVEVVAAATMLTTKLPDLRVIITGRPKIAERLGGIAIPGNVTLSGYLSEHDFEMALSQCDAIMDLTTRDDCMVCGAYEAVAAGKPGLLSGNTATRNYFSSGFLFTDNTAEDIANRLFDLHFNRESLSVQIRLLRDEMTENDRRNAELLGAAIPTCINEAS